MSFKLEIADIDWIDGEPRSKLFEDVYYSREGGLNESQHVFLRPNRIQQRLTETDTGNTFTIAETGFGTGLNFLATLQAWQQLPEPKKNLHFVSVEKFPLDKAGIEKAHASFPSLSKLSAEFLARYPMPIKGPHTLQFSGGRVTLLLIFGDIQEELPGYHFRADAWYLDGFNPSSNASMWSESLFEIISRHSRPGTTLSTFTSAGFVRRGLAALGFTMQKRKGFGSKREMLVGERTASDVLDSSYFAEISSNWTIPDASCGFEPPTHSASPGIRTKDTERNSTCAPYDVVIIGAGLSGLCSAISLATKGYQTLVMDRRNDAMQGASGQSSLMMYAKLPAIVNREAELIVAATTFAQQFYQELQTRHPTRHFWEATGLLQLDWSSVEQKQNEKRHRNLELPTGFMQKLDRDQASEMAGISLETGAIWFPQNGRLYPAEFARACLESTGVETCFGEAASHLDYCSRKSLWTVTSSSRQVQAHHVIVANAYEADVFEQTKGFPTNTIRGQVSTLFEHQHANPKCILCGEGYVSANTDGSLHIGATYDLQGSSEKSTAEDHMENIEKCARWMPSNWLDTARLNSARYESRAGIRCTSRDYQPLVGQVPFQPAVLQDFSSLRVDRHACKAVKGKFYPKLYLNIAHGSKGVTTAPIAAELISSLIAGTPSPLGAKHQEMLHPARFLIRDLIRGKI